MNALLLKNIKDIDSIVNTPRSRYTTTDLEFPLLEYEEGGKIEMPWYTEAKKLQRKQAPVNKAHEKRNFKGIQESEQVAVTIVRNSM